jgi:hypothetical protein
MTTDRINFFSARQHLSIRLLYKIGFMYLKKPDPRNPARTLSVKMVESRPFSSKRLCPKVAKRKPDDKKISRPRDPGYCEGYAQLQNGPFQRLTAYQL